MAESEDVQLYFINSFKNKKMKKIGLFVVIWLGVVSYSYAQRIVSLSGTLTEILAGLGLEKNIVGVDVTSTFPITVDKLPKVGHVRQVGSEAILSLRPTEVVVLQESGFRPELVRQLEQAGVKVTQFKQTFSPAGTEELIKQMALHYKKGVQGQKMIQTMRAQMRKTVAAKNRPKVLFIYARGAGSLQVSGKNTSVDQLIHLAGGSNAVQGFDDFKPLTTESLVAANPDYILLFSSGLQSIGGMEGLLKIPGMKLTTAGKKQQIIEMDGLLLTGFGPRLGLAVQTLHKRLYP